MKIQKNKNKLDKMDDVFSICIVLYTLGIFVLIFALAYFHVDYRIVVLSFIGYFVLYLIMTVVYTIHREKIKNELKRKNR